MNGIESTVSLRVKVTNLLDQSTVGTIHSMTPSQAVMAIKLDGHKTKIINTAFIKSIHVLTPPHKKHFSKYNSQQWRKPAKVDVAAIDRDANAALANYKPTNRDARDHREHRDHRDPNSLPQKIFSKFADRFGKENVTWLHNDTISIWNDVQVSRPYVLNKISKKSPRSDEVRAALKQIWLDVDSHKRGG